MESDIQPHTALQPTSADSSLMLWPAIVAAAVPIGLLLASAAPYSLLIFMLLWSLLPVWLVGWIIAALVALWIGIRSAMRQAWRRAFSALILPVVVATVLCNFPQFLIGTVKAGDSLHLELVRDRYLLEVGVSRVDGKPLIMSWDWPNMTARGVVYDETDQIISSQPSAPWKEQAAKTKLQCGHYRPRAMGGHFYVVEFNC
jgi:hypothetical protein